MSRYNWKSLEKLNKSEALISVKHIKYSTKITLQFDLKLDTDRPQGTISMHR